MLNTQCIDLQIRGDQAVSRKIVHNFNQQLPKGHPYSDPTVTDTDTVSILS